MHIRIPLALDPTGATITADASAHIREMMVLILCTDPGERVNRPDFGCGLRRALFDVMGVEELTGLRFTVLEQLQRWLGDRVEFLDVDILREDSRIDVEIKYREHAGRAPSSLAVEFTDGA